MNVINFSCNKCGEAFYIESKNKNINTSKCPKCSSIVFKLIKKEEKKIKKICDSCKCQYQEEDNNNRICKSCKDKNRPFGVVFTGRNLTKKEIKNAEALKNIEKRYRESASCAEIILRNAILLGVKKEDIKYISDFMIKYTTICNKAKEEKIDDLLSK